MPTSRRFALVGVTLLSLLILTASARMDSARIAITFIALFYLSALFIWVVDTRQAMVRNRSGVERTVDALYALEDLMFLNQGALDDDYLRRGIVGGFKYTLDKENRSRHYLISSLARSLDDCDEASFISVQIFTLEQEIKTLSMWVIAVRDEAQRKKLLHQIGNTLNALISVRSDIQLFSATHQIEALKEAWGAHSSARRLFKENSPDSVFFALALEERAGVMIGEIEHNLALSFRYSVDPPE